MWETYPITFRQVVTVDILLFPFANYWWFYAGFTAFVLSLLVLDLGVFHKTPHKVTVKEAGIWTAVWVTLALAFNVAFYFYARHRFQIDPRLVGIPGFDATIAAKQVALEFLTGFVVEKSLAIDNIFIFAVVFSYFAIPAKYQHRILFYGIIGALIFRAIFISLGSVLMQYHLVVILFGVLLLLTGIKMLLKPDKQIEPEKNLIIRLLRRFIPISSTIEGRHFIVVKNGHRYASPLLVALIFLEFSDIIFAVDSVPAIFSLTKEPLIVFTSNIFAIMGLRSMYFLLAGVMDSFHYLKYGLGLVLIFVGLKMVWLNKLFDGEFPIGASLGIIGGIVALSIVASYLFPPKKKQGMA